jgi:hypothetical protein
MRIKCHRLNGNELCGKDATVDRSIVMALSMSMYAKLAEYTLSLCDEHGEEFDRSPVSSWGERSNRDA